MDVKGNKEHPITRGTLCVKLKDFHDHHANPDRLMYPLRRVGPKGSGPNGGNTFERSTWDEAISEIGRRWREIIAEYGAQAIMPQSYLGNMGLVQGINSGDPFFNRLGSTVNEKTYCTSGSSSAWLLTYGPTGGVELGLGRLAPARPSVADLGHRHDNKGEDDLDADLRVVQAGVALLAH